MAESDGVVSGPKQQNMEELQSGLIAGLSVPVPRLSPRWLYDRRGSELFARITEQPEYYLTRVEQRIYEQHGRALARAVAGEKVTLVEPGSGASTKVASLLRHLPPGSRYIGFDISPTALQEAALRLGEQFPEVELQAVVGDFTTGMPELPTDQPRVVFFPGSTIGNFAPDNAQSLLRSFADAADRLILGSDLWKSPERLHAAYDDAAGFSARFALNALVHLTGRELIAAEPEAFEYEAFVCPVRHRVEMYLRPTRSTEIRIGSWSRTFSPSERILTECSYKPTSEELQEAAARAGWTTREVFTDVDGDFGVFRMDTR